MTCFNKVIYHPETSSVDVPTRVIWDDLYAALEPYHVNVVGGRVSGIGATGLTLGGNTTRCLDCGYLTDPSVVVRDIHGLTVYSVAAFEHIPPSGRVIEVTDYTFSDLFFGLKDELLYCIPIEALV
ncbi:uncharacterized protein EI90DRAFT_2968735 [Cantharellus anzutake]|uniref:uncharacterized protein n=1 Tax=Cantharellus anzutake TaxID=1750568 RepID=UPI0019083451|nr:uncharacterized protein EI90DRAFT_2968735 [Cantharellus anzutake]KAF8337001.1 hypothetical protein EI90DRAFT_2968735 [Cantharellus anzutake]